MLRLAYVIALLVPSALFLLGCADDYGVRCDLPDTPDIQRTCFGDDEDREATEPSCAFTLSSECSQRVCAVYRGSDPFCSQRCDDAADCPDGSSCVSVAGASRVCIPPEMRRDG